MAAIWKVKYGTRMFRHPGLWLAIVALASTDHAWGQHVPATRETLVAAAERAPGPTKGRGDAPITIVEFSDFQCSFCRKFWKETLPKIEAEYINTGKVRFVYPPRGARPGVGASRRGGGVRARAREILGLPCYHDALFERGGRLSPDARLMEQMRLDPMAFEACLA